MLGHPTLELVIASVLAPHFLYKVHFGSLSELKLSDLDSEHNDVVNSDKAEGVGAKRIPRSC